MSEFTLTANDYTEIKTLSINELKSSIYETEEDIVFLTNEYEEKLTLTLQGHLYEARMWLKAYQEELNKRTIITTPKCQGCKDGALNQQAHYGFVGGCLEEPGFNLCPF